MGTRLRFCNGPSPRLQEVALSGHGLRSSAMVRERGAAAVYVDHVREVARLARRHWRRVLFFAEFADTRYRPHAQGSDDHVRALRDAGLSFVNWNYYDDKPEEYFPFLHLLQRHGVDQVISPGVWTWRQLFPSFTLTRETLPVFTKVGFGEGVTDSITCAWNDTRDCFRELHYLNYAFAAEHQWNGAAPVEAAEPFIARWAERFFGAPADALARAHAWLGDLNAKAFAAGRHDHRYPRDFNWRPMAAHALFWNYPVPGAGRAQDAAASERLAGEARELEGEVNAAAASLPRNRPVVDLVAYELRRAPGCSTACASGRPPTPAPPAGWHGSCGGSAATSCRSGTRPTSRRGGKRSRSGSPSWPDSTSRRRGRSRRGTATGVRRAACRSAPTLCDRGVAGRRRRALAPRGGTAVECRGTDIRSGIVRVSGPKRRWSRRREGCDGNA